MVVELDTDILQIVGADNCRVATGVTSTEPALLDDANVGDPMLLGQIIRGRKTVAATADNDDIVAPLRL